GTFFTSKVARIVLNGYLQSHSRTPRAQTLTARQRQVLRLLASGKANKQVAADLGISPKTIEVHRRDIMKKLEFASFSDLVRYAIRERIIEA
ncbi:MAG TPA: response regulator transcription factor, partial [Terriglobia bacterium]|nr:response regulator transcription factor [Terriglobia bacterium]